MFGRATISLGIGPHSSSPYFTKICQSVSYPDQKQASKQTNGAKVNITLILECGPMPNLMVALPNAGGALCSTPQSLADARY